MKKSAFGAALLAAAVVTPVRAQLELVPNGSSQAVTSIPGPGTLGYFIVTDGNDVSTSNIGDGTSGTLADFSPDAYDTTGPGYSTLTIAGTAYQTGTEETASTTNSAVLATITLGSNVPSSFQLGFLAGNTDNFQYENETTLTLTATGGATVTLATYSSNYSLNTATNNFYYVDVLNAQPGEVITISGSSGYPSVDGTYNMELSGITFDPANPVTYTWTGAGDGTFDNSQGTSTPSNWTGGTGSNYPGPIDTAGFNTSSKTAVSFTGNDTVNAVIFGVNGANASSYTFAAGDTLTIRSDLAINAGVSGATETFNGAIAFGGNSTLFNQGSDSTLNLSSVADPTGGLTLQGGQGYGTETAGDRAIDIAGVISGAGGIIANLAGTVADFETSNTYTGTTVLNSGILKYTGSATSGTPFGTGSIALDGGKLLIAPGGSGTDSLTGASASGATFSYTAGATIQLTAPIGGSLTYTIGSGTGTVISTSVFYPSLIIESSTGATLGTTENLVVSGTAPTLTDGIVGDNVVGESASNGYGSYLTDGLAGTSGFSDYNGGTVLVLSTTGSNSTNYVVGPTGWTYSNSGNFVFNTLTDTGGTISGNTLQFNSANGSAGMILNNATVNNALSFTGAGSIYAAGNSVLNGNYTSTGQVVTIFGPGTLTLNGAGGGGTNNAVSAFELNGPGAIKINSASEISGGAGNANPASLFFNGGTLDTTATLALDGSNGAGSNGATAMSFNSGGGTFDVANNTTLAVTGVMGASGEMYKTDGGTLIATGDNVFTGSVTIGAVDYQTRDAAVANTSTTVGGTMLFTGTNMQTITTVAGNGTNGSSILGGTGSITATNNTLGQSSGIFVQNGGQLAPGITNANSTAGLTGLSATNSSAAAVGTFTFTGAGTTPSEVNLTNGGNFLWTLGDEKDGSTGTAGVDFSQLVLSGNTLLQLGGTSSLTLKFLAGISPTDTFWDSDHLWQIINDTDGATSDGTTFTSITDPDYADGIFSVVNDGTGEELLYTLSAVPEPSVVALLGLGSVMGLLAWRQRKTVLAAAC